MNDVSARRQVKPALNGRNDHRVRVSRRDVVGYSQDRSTGVDLQVPLPLRNLRLPQRKTANRLRVAIESKLRPGHEHDGRGVSDLMRTVHIYHAVSSDDQPSGYCQARTLVQD